MNTPHTFTTPGGEEMVILPKADYDALIEALADAEEDEADAAIYAQRKAELTSDDILPAKVSEMITKGSSRLRAIRVYKDLSQVELAQAMGIAQSYLSALENGDRNLTDELADKLASALIVPRNWVAS